MFVEKHLEDPLRWRKPKKIFVNSMSDLFHEGVTTEQLYKIFAVMMLASQHTFQVLTKRPERMRAFLSGELEKPLNGVGDSVWFAAREMVERFPRYDGQLLAHSERPVWPLKNVWCGVSVEHQNAADQRIPLLLQTPAAVRFLSCEPLLGPVALIPQSTGGYPESLRWADFGPDSPRIDWVIVGGESGPNAREFDLAWARDLAAQCQVADIACFIKQMGSNPVDPWADTGSLVKDRAPAVPTFEDSHGGNIEEWPTELRIREFPEVLANA